MEQEMAETPIEISCHELKELMDGQEPILLIDCREPEEHAIVSLPGARLVPMQEIPTKAAEIIAEGSPRLVVYCHHGMRSAQTAGWLRENGAPHAQSLAGGVDAWAVQIDPNLPRY